MDGHMTIKRPEVEFDPGVVNKSFEFESRRSVSLDFDLPERDYEVTGNGLIYVCCISSIKRTVGDGRGITVGLPSWSIEFTHQILL